MGSKDKAKIYDKPKKLQGPQNENNKSMMIFNNPFPNFIKSKSKKLSINFVSGFIPMHKKGTKCYSYVFHC